MINIFSVSDHDVFGTHENDEDSLDSLMLRDDIIEDESDLSHDINDSCHDSSLRPKRKSGSLSELTLPGSLPLKKQRPESLLCHSSVSNILLETPDSATENTNVKLITNAADEDDDIADTVTCDTAPTSPRSPPPVSLLGVPGVIIRPQGRSLIPDKENPPQDILDWVSTFSRWSHAERLLAIDQLIDR